MVERACVGRSANCSTPVHVPADCDPVRRGAGAPYDVRIRQ